MAADAFAPSSPASSIVPITTTGDAISARRPRGGWVETDGQFTRDIERALLEGRIDLAVHSYKDLPTGRSKDWLSAPCCRAPTRATAWSPRDGGPLEALPTGARIGTSSPRRAAQLRAARPDLVAIAASAATSRRASAAPARASSTPSSSPPRASTGSGSTCRDHARLPFDLLLPAPAQGALALQVRRRRRDLSPAAGARPPPHAHRRRGRATPAPTDRRRLPRAARCARRGDGRHAPAARRLRHRNGSPPGRGDGPGRRRRRRDRAHGAARSSAHEADRILVTRPAEQADELAALLAARGLEPLAVPTVAIDIESTAAGARRHAGTRSTGADWLVLTSANGAEAVAARLATNGIALPAGLRVAAVGPATAAALARPRHRRRPRAGRVPHRRDRRRAGDRRAAGASCWLAPTPPRRTCARRSSARGADRRGGRRVPHRSRAPRPAATCFTQRCRRPRRHRLHERLDRPRPGAPRLAGRPRPRARALPAFCIGPVTAAEARRRGLPHPGRRRRAYRRRPGRRDRRSHVAREDR